MSYIDDQALADWTVTSGTSRAIRACKCKDEIKVKYFDDIGDIQMTRQIWTAAASLEADRKAEKLAERLRRYDGYTTFNGKDGWWCLARDLLNAGFNPKDLDR